MNAKVITFIVLVLFSALVFSEPSKQLPTKGTGPWIVNVYYKDLKQLQEYAKKQEPWSVDAKAQFFTTQVNKLSEYQELIDNGFLLEINTKRMQSSVAIKEAIARDIRKNGSLDTKSIPGLACYRTVEETFATMDQLVASYPTLATVLDVGDTWNKIDSGGTTGYDMRVLKITNTAVAGPKPVLFAISSIHARELAPAEFNTRFAEYLLNNYGTNADVTWLVDNREIHLMLQGNPDGRKIAEANTGSFSNKRKNEDNLFCSNQFKKGVDMNRNFEWMWNQGSGSSATDCDETFRGGTSAATVHAYEPENLAINTHMNNIFSDQRGPGLSDAAPDNTTGVYIDIHSYSELVLWPYGYDSPGAIPEAPNHNQLQTLGRKFAWYNDYLPEKSNELYGADGASDDNAYGQLGIAAYTFELGTSFAQDCATFENTILPDNLKALIYAAKVADTPYITASGPDIENLALSTSSGNIVAGDLVTVTGRASDTHFSHNLDTTAHPAETEQVITKVELFIDESPWDAGATPVLLNASDGNFNSVAEDFTGQINTTGMSLGQHIVYVQTTDASGVTGVPYAQFFTIVNPADLGTLMGTITDATTNLPIDVVNVSYNGLQTSTNVSGSYSFSSLASTADLIVSKQGYAPQTIVNVSVVASQTTTQNIQLQPLCALLDESVETFNNIADAQTAGWSHGFVSGSDDWSVNLTGGVSATHAFSTSDPGETTDKWLISPAMDLSADSVLEFWHKFGFEGTSTFYDGGVLEVATNGSFNNWVDLGSLASVGGYNATLNSGNPLGAVSAWGGVQATFQRVEVPLATYAGTTAKIRWRMAADSTIGGSAPWVIDDIQVLDPNVCNASNPDVLFINGFE